jgi:hypothetical protein
MQDAAHIRPGMYPAMKSAPTEVEETIEYTIIVFEGGMSMPAGAEAMLAALAQPMS